MTEVIRTTAEIRKRHASAWAAPYRDEMLRDFDQWLKDHDANLEARTLRVAAVGIRVVPNLGPASAGKWLEDRATRSLDSLAGREP